MFNYMLKNIPAKYVFGGYSVRKSFTIMTSIENGKLVYDSFLFTYVDNYLSFYVLMDDGNYKHVESGVAVPEIKAEELMSKHLARGKVDEDEYSQYERDKIVGVFGLRNMEEIMRQTDQMNVDSKTEDIKLTGLSTARSTKDLKSDIEDTIRKSIEITPEMLKTNILNRIFRAFVRIFAPML